MSRGIIGILAACAVLTIAVLSAGQLRIIEGILGGERRFLELIGRQGLAALAWLPAAVAVVWLSRKKAVSRKRWPSRLLVHAAGIVAVAAYVNLAIPGLWHLAGYRPATETGLFGLFIRGFVQFLHVNALVYVVIAGTVHALSRPGGPPPPARTGDGDADGTPDQPVRRLAVRRAGELRMVDTEDIRWVEAAGDYVRLHLRAEALLMTERMAVLERELDGKRFLRVHRSAIINLEVVREVRSLPSGDAVAVLMGGEEIRVSRRRKNSLLNRLSPAGA